MPFLWLSSGKFSSEKIINQKWGKEINILHNYKFMARFWLNLGRDDCHFVHLLLRTNHHFGWGCKTKNSWRKHWCPTACMQAATTTMSELCVCTWVPYLHCIFSSLPANYNWLGTCQFFLMLQQLCMQCNAMQYLVEHWPLLITVYLQLIFGKSCWIFF